MTVLKGLAAPAPVIAMLAGGLLLPAGVFCGVWAWPRAWGFIAVAAVASMTGSAVLAVARPASFRVRQQGLVAAPQRRQPLIDAAGSLVYAMSLVLWLAFIPLDVFRFRLLPPPGLWPSAAGAAAALAGVAVSYVAIGQNQFAAPTIHDQSAEGQRVIDTGLYGIVRHPFYAGMLLVYAGSALWLGSYAALIGTTAFLVMTLARIVIEEAFLRRELPAYAAYARRVRGRLIPGVL